MFTNSTVLDLYARARREDDLRHLPPRPQRQSGFSLRGLLRRLSLRPAPAPVPAPVQSRSR